MLVCALDPLVISALLSSPLANTPAPPSLFWPSALTPCRTVPRAGSGLLGPARGPARLRSDPRARGAAAGGSPRHAARASSLRLSGPAGLARLRRLRPATVARGAAAGPGPGARLAARPLRFPDPAGPDRTHGAFRHSPRRSSRSRPAGPPRHRRCSPVTTARGGDACSSLPVTPAVGSLGVGGRALTRQAPCWPGTEGEGSGAVPISLHPGCARVRSSLRNYISSRSG